jgi:hypothetical protein
MLVLHVAAIKKRDTAVFLWAEAAEKGRLQGKRKSTWSWLSGRKHPYYAERELLAAALPAETMQMGFWLWLTAWLPSDGEGPLPSEEGIAPRSGRKAEQLAPCGVRVLGAAAGCLHDLLLARRRTGTAWRFGAEGPFLERVHELAGALVARQQFLPGITHEKGPWLPDWYPVYSADDVQWMAQLAEAMRVSIRALHWYGLRPPVDTPHWIVDSLIQRLVGTMVKKAELPYRVYQIALHRRRAESADDLWLETLLVPGTEIHARKRDLIGLANEIGCWRAGIHRMPKLEWGDDLPEMSLPPNGGRFWSSGQLPKPIPCPEMPSWPAAILQQAGALPNWQGAAPLSESLPPVYEAASRYALEHVFGRREEERHR